MPNSLATSRTFCKTATSSGDVDVYLSTGIPFKYIFVFTVFAITAFPFAFCVITL